VSTKKFLTLFYRFKLSHPSFSQTLAEKSLQQVAVISVSKQTGLVRQLLGNVFSPQTQMLSSQVTGVSVSSHLRLYLGI